MSWQHWIILALWVVRLLTVAAEIGKPRKPVTTEGAVGGFLVCLNLIMLLIWGQP